MKKLIVLLFLAPIIVWAEDIVVPDLISDTVETTVDGFVTKTWIMSSVMMAIIQALKKIMSAFKLDLSGIKSQIAAIIITTLYVLVNMNVWQDGQISPNDVLIMIQGVISAVGGIYGYKVLWRNKNNVENKPKEGEI